MYQLIYVSTAVKQMSADALRELLTIARRNNIKEGVTGMLLYHEGSFFQVLEGEEEAVQGIFRRVERDSRHRMVTVLMEQDVDERAFGDWSMAFRSLGEFDPEEVPGFSGYLEKSANADDFDGSAEAYDLMETFRAYLR